MKELHYTLTDYTNGEIMETDDVEYFYEYAQTLEDSGYEIVKVSRMNWEVHEGDDEPYEDWGDEIGYNPYMGCYDWDC